MNMPRAAPAPGAPPAPLRVLIIGRISTPHQNEENIEASYRYVEDYLHTFHPGPLQIKHLGERASGMLAERQTIRQAEDLMATGQIDLVVHHHDDAGCLDVRHARAFYPANQPELPKRTRFTRGTPAAARRGRRTCDAARSARVRAQQSRQCLFLTNAVAKREAVPEHGRTNRAIRIQRGRTKPPLGRHVRQ